MTPLSNFLTLSSGIFRILSKKNTKKAIDLPKTVRPMVSDYRSSKQFIRIFSGINQCLNLIDYTLAAGLRFYPEIGSRIEKGEPIAELFASDRSLPAQAAVRVEKAVIVGEEPVVPPPLIYEKEETT